MYNPHGVLPCVNYAAQYTCMDVDMQAPDQTTMCTIYIAVMCSGTLHVMAHSIIGTYVVLNVDCNILIC